MLSIINNYTTTHSSSDLYDNFYLRLEYRSNCEYRHNLHVTTYMNRRKHIMCACILNTLVPREVKTNVH